jgi:hypothetical protein
LPLFEGHFRRLQSRLKAAHLKIDLLQNQASKMQNFAFGYTSFRCHLILRAAPFDFARYNKPPQGGADLRVYR